MNNNMNDFLNVQRKMMENWQDMMKNMTTFTMPGMNQDDKAETTNPFTNMNPMFAGMNPFMNVFNNVMGSNYDPMKMFENFSGNPFTMMNEINSLIFETYNVYNKIYNETLEPSEENFQEMMKELRNQGLQQFERMALPFFPPQTKALISEWMSMNKTLESVLGEVWSPWLDNFRPFMDAMIEGILVDPSAYIHVLEEWRRDYEETTQKLLHMPAFGIGRNVIESQARTLDKYFVLNAQMAEMIAKVYDVINKQSEEYFERAYTAFMENEEKISFEDFYTAWMGTISESIENMLGTPEFSQLLGNLVTALSEFKINYDKLVERQLKTLLPIPTNTEIRSVYEKVYNLQRDVRTLKKEVEELKKNK